MTWDKLKRIVSELLIAFGVLAIGGGAIVGFARRALFLPEGFSDRLASSVADPRVSAFVAERVADAAIRGNPDITAFRPFLVATAHAAVSSPAFQGLLRATARTAHRTVFSEGGRTVILSVPDVGVLLRSALATANPALAAKIPPRVQGVLGSIGERQADRFFLDLWRVARRLTWLARGLFVGGVLCVFVGIGLAPERRRALAKAGLDLVIVGLLLLVLVPVGRVVVSSLPANALARDAAAGLWDAFMGSLRTWAMALGGAGVVLSAAGFSLIERVDLRQALGRALAWLEDAEGGRARGLARGAVFILAGGFAISRPADALACAAVLGGAALAFAGLGEVFALLLPAAPEAETRDRGPSSGRARWRVAVVVALAAVLVLGIAWVGVPPAQPIRPLSDACNGSPGLCERRVDEVVFPATHNSMSAADIPDWLFPQQEKSIPGQLQDGIRGLLFDVHYGIPVGARVKTDLDRDLGSRDKLDKAVGKEGVDAAMRIRDRLAGKEEGKRGLYLCHGFCELGATPLVASLRAVHAFLVENPNEVLVFVIEDYVTAEDLAAVFEESGLAGLAYRGAPGPPWPTLREMVDRGERVLVLTESGRPGVAWIHPAFDAMQETPYSFHAPSELSCVPNRGGTSGSLFLVNNWIDTTPTPKPSNAALVNAYEALLARAQRCASERGKRPNLLAVDFYETGDLFRVARTLNEPGR